MKRIESKSPLNFIFDIIEEQIYGNRGLLKIFYQNLPYLGKHAIDLESDPLIKSSDILLLVETRASTVSISGFNLVSQIEYQSSRPFGIAMYARNTVSSQVKSIGSDTILGKDSHFEYLMIEVKNVYIMLLYISPSFRKTDAIGIICGIVDTLRKSSGKIILIGDFNINVIDKSGKTLLDKLSDIGLNLSLPLGSPSNDYNNQIDLAFSSFPLQYSGYYESLVSDHKPIFLII